MKIIPSALLILLAALLPGCAGTHGIDRTTSAINASEAGRPDNYTLVYSIPRTTVDVSVNVTQTITRRGPYYQYAERFLGIPGVPSQDATTWRIGDIEINTYEEADAGHYYLLSTNDRHVTNFFRLSREGFILPINQRQLPELQGTRYGLEKTETSPLFTDLSIHPNVVEETRTVMRRERQDTAFVNVPVLQRQSVTRSLEAKAAEAADLIYELRNNRFKLLSGELDIFPDGKALEVIIEEFARLEKEYLSLFIGKISESDHVYKFEYSPSKDALQNGAERRILFRFSDTSGILPYNDVSGRPIAMELRNEMKTSSIERLTAPTQASRANGPNRLVYRVPDVAGVQLTDGNKTIARKRILVSQYGNLVNLPADFLWEK
jgi:hypothetical protein